MIILALLIRMSHVAGGNADVCTNESYHIWMSHATYEWVTSHMNESYLMGLFGHVCHFSNEWVMSQLTMPMYVWMSLVTYEWVISYMTTHENEWVISHMIILSPLIEWVMSYVSMPTFITECVGLACVCVRERDTHTPAHHPTGTWNVDESRHIWVRLCHIRMSHVTYP